MPGGKISSEQLNYRLSCFARRFKLLKTALVFLSLHLLLIFISGTLISTVLLTYSVYVIVCWAVIKVIRKLKMNPDFIWSTVFVFVLFFGFEMYLKYIDKRAESYTERVWGSFLYISPYKFHNLWPDTYSMTEEPNSILEQSTPQFKYMSRINNLGFRGEDIGPKKAGEYRILAFGDSYTFGIGTPDDSTWPMILQKDLQNRTERNGTEQNRTEQNRTEQNRTEQNRTVRVINMGKKGCDPIYSYHEYKTHFDSLSPDAVLLSVSTTDITDITERGGKERYRNGKLWLRTSPWWEFFYALSPVVRYTAIGIFKCDGILIPKRRAAEEYAKSVKSLDETILDFNKDCKNNGSRFYLIIMPTEYELENKDAYAELEKLHTHTEQLNQFPVIFLADCYKSELTATGTKPSDYYWSLDYHHNSKGYKLFGDCVNRQFTFK